jgi:hypothetical protein
MLGSDFARGMGQLFVAALVIAACVGAALFWLASFLYRHIDITVRWT